MEGNNNVEYVLRWTDQIDEQFIDDFLEIENAVFGGFSRELFDRKYMANIYGPSLLTIAYLDNEPIGADVMVRNDIYGRIAFETSDTCVSEKCRGKGVFRTITEKEVDEIISKYDNPIIYGFPNGNSYPGYVKMGWTVLRKFYPMFFLFPFLYNREYPQKIDIEYAKWLSVSSCKFYYFKKCGKYYLASRGRKYYQMVGGIEPDAAILFERKRCFGIVRYQSSRKRFFHKDKYHGSLICYGISSLDIPYWKIDTLLN